MLFDQLKDYVKEKKVSLFSLSFIFISPFLSNNLLLIYLFIAHIILFSLSRLELSPFIGLWGERRSLVWSMRERLCLFMMKLLSKLQ